FVGRRRDPLAVASDEARRRRLRCVTAEGTSVALDLARGSFLHARAVLHDDGETIIVVERAMEPALVVCLDPDLPRELALGQAARVGHWAGNQHLLVETAGNEIRVRIATTPELMLRAAQALDLAGAQISVASVPFACDRPPSIAHAHG
nr:urease accessory protein UreE [Thermoleophilaceae bacterium]